MHTCTCMCTHAHVCIPMQTQEHIQARTLHAMSRKLIWTWAFSKELETSLPPCQYLSPRGWRRSRRQQKNRSHKQMSTQANGCSHTLTSKGSSWLHERLQLALVTVEPGSHLQQWHLLNQVMQRQGCVEPAVNRHCSCLHGKPSRHSHFELG